MSDKNGAKEDLGAETMVIMSSVIDSIVFETAIEMHWHAKTGYMDIDELYNLNPIAKRIRIDSPVEISPSRIFNGGSLKANTKLTKKETASSSKNTDQNSSSSCSSNSYASSLMEKQLAQCPICNQLVAGGRFAPHLERCLAGGKRGGIGAGSGSIAPTKVTKGSGSGSGSGSNSKNGSSRGQGGSNIGKFGRGSYGVIELCGLSLYTSVVLFLLG